MGEVIGSGNRVDSVSSMASVYIRPSLCGGVVSNLFSALSKMLCISSIALFNSNRVKRVTGMKSAKACDSLRLEQYRREELEREYFSRDFLRARSSMVDSRQVNSLTI